MFYNQPLSGSNSAVECDLAKVEVAGSNPVSRSRLLIPAFAAPLREPSIMLEYMHFEIAVATLVVGMAIVIIVIRHLVDRG